MHLVPQLELFVIYAVMALVLRFRPQGLFSQAAAAEDLTMRTATTLLGALRLRRGRRWPRRALPPWLISLATIAFANALVVLGLIILWRAGLVPFGQALFYAIGAYAVALLGRYRRLRDVFLLIAAGAVAAGIVAFLVGFLLARYREIFFAMLSLALSMILYGVLVKTETLGSTDGFNVEAGSFLGLRPHGPTRNLALFWLVLGVFGGRRLPGRRSISARSPAALADAGPRQRNPRRVSRHLGRPADPSEVDDFGGAGGRRRRAGGARGQPCRSADGLLDHVGRICVRHHPGRRGLGRGRVRGLAAVRDACAPSPSTCCPAAGS